MENINPLPEQKQYRKFLYKLDGGRKSELGVKKVNLLYFVS